MRLECIWSGFIRRLHWTHMVILLYIYMPLLHNAPYLSIYIRTRMDMFACDIGMKFFSISINFFSFLCIACMDVNEGHISVAHME